MDQLLAKLIENLEVELLQPDVRQSEARLDELLADDFLEIGASGKCYTKQDILKRLPVSEGTNYKGTDFKAMKIAPGTVLLTYRASAEDLRTGSKKWAVRSSLWQKRGDQWQILFHQGTPQNE